MKCALKTTVWVLLKIIWSDFFQDFTGPPKMAEGTGLGLYIVKGAIEKLNGKILVQSEPGIGTAFDIEIPNQTKRRL